VILGDFNTLSPIARSSKQQQQQQQKKKNKETSELNDTVEQIVLKGNHGVFNSTVAVHGTFSKIDHILRHKASLN
jgi:endonuclease/exonuclease/phosphatase family metal-dependent hydrolase